MGRQEQQLQELTDPVGGQELQLHELTVPVGGQEQQLGQSNILKTPGRCHTPVMPTSSRFCCRSSNACTNASAYLPVHLRPFEG